MLSINFTTDNASFDGPDKPIEISRILSKISTRIAQGSAAGPIIDNDGNKVGEWELT